MQDALVHLVDYALARGLYVSVSDGVKKSRDRQQILEDAKACDEHMVSIWEKRDPGDVTEGLGGVGPYKCLGKAFIINEFEGAPDERIADHAVNPWFDAWSAEYKKAIGEG